MPRVATTLAGLVLVVVPGMVACSSATDAKLETIQQQLADLREQIGTLSQRAATRDALATLDAALTERERARIDAQTDHTGRLDAIAGEVERLAVTIDAAVSEVGDLRRDIDLLTERLVALRGALTEHAAAPPLSSSPSPLPDRPIDAQTLYDTAYEHFQRGSYRRAIRGFEQYLEAYPRTDLADNATYWLGESYYQLNQPRRAVIQFDAVISRFPDSDRVPSALLKKGYAFLELDRRADGIAQLRRVIDAYPGSDEAQLAGQRLRELGIDAGG